jgi:hypothetical protein
MFLNYCQIWVVQTSVNVVVYSKTVYGPLQYLFINRESSYTEYVVNLHNIFIRTYTTKLGNNVHYERSSSS